VRKCLNWDLWDIGDLWEDEIPSPQGEGAQRADEVKRIEKVLPLSARRGVGVRLTI